jgi:Holliday junction resolvase RusA-like endonuclease
MIVASFEIPPIPKGRHRVTRRGHVYTPEKTRNFETMLKLMAKEFAVTPVYTGPLRVEVTFYLAPPGRAKNFFPIVKPDLDNFVKTLDAFNGIFWVDDSQVCELEARKHYDWKHGKGAIQMTVTELPEHKTPKAQRKKAT